MKTMFERAAEAYAKHPSPRGFSADVELHLLHGFLFARPDFFIMGRPIVSHADPADILNPEIHFASADCDCWNVYLMAGNVAKAWEILPWPLPWFCWERGNELRFYRADAIRRLSLPTSP